MKWFLKHQQWLYEESARLSDNPDYHEDCQFCRKTFVSSGEIIVRKNETAYHPILIVYPESTPYTTPKIYVLKEKPDRERVLFYSTLSPGKIEQKIANNVSFFNRRHQNQDGSVCFIETGDLHGDNAEIFPIDGILKRLRLWLSGKIPKDSREVELFCHFRCRHDKLNFLIPDTFFNTSIVKGNFYATESAVFNTVFSDVVKKSYVGIFLVGESSAGVSMLPEIYSRDERILFAHMPDNILELIRDNKKDKVQNGIDRGKIIEGPWWDITVEPKPFDSVEQLAEYIGAGNKDAGFDEMQNALSHDLRRGKDIIYVGIRFPGRHSGREWQFFTLERSKNQLIVNPTKEQLVEQLKLHSLKAVQHERITEECFHMRNKGRADRDILKNKMVSVIGCGALGSELADSLAKSGIGQMMLVDKEELKVHNVVRHTSGLDRVNWPKVTAMHYYLLLHNPFVIYHTNGINILSDGIDTYLPHGTIGVSSIADDNVESFLNEQAIESNREVFYIRALRGGKVGRIFRVIPGRDACKNCLALYSREGNNDFIKIDEDNTLPVLTNECNNPVRPASAADLKVIASLGARIIIDYLQQGNSDENHWIWSTEPLEGFDLAQSKALLSAQFIPPHPNCVVCQALEDKKVVLQQGAYNFMRNESSLSNDIETGGVLVGHIDEKGTYCVLKASGPGPNAIRTKVRFEKEERYCQEFLERMTKELGVKGAYLGEWHYHPTGTNDPSGQDIKSLSEIAKQEEYRIDKPISIILAPDLEYVITVHDKDRQFTKISFQIE